MHGEGESEAVSMSFDVGQPRTFDIVLKHPGGERKTVPVEYVSPSLVFLTIRWGQSGMYDLHLRLNVLRAHSARATRRGKPLWVAEDIVAVRKMAQEYLAEKRGDTPAARQAAYERHTRSMPAGKSTDLKQDPDNVYADESTDSSES